MREKATKPAPALLDLSVHIPDRRFNGQFKALADLESMRQRGRKETVLTL